jgi:hypothetical protein
MPKTRFRKNSGALAILERTKRCCELQLAMVDFFFHFIIANIRSNMRRQPTKFFFAPVSLSACGAISSLSPCFSVLALLVAIMWALAAVTYMIFKWFVWVIPDLPWLTALVCIAYINGRSVGTGTYRTANRLASVVR